MTHSFPTPEKIVRTQQLGPHFTKFFLEETGRPLHYLKAPDTGYPHNHNYRMISHVLVNGYEEEVYTLLGSGAWTVETVQRLEGTSHEILPGTIHRITKLLGGPCLTHVEPFEWVQHWSFFDFREDKSVWRQDGETRGEWERINLPHPNPKFASGPRLHL
jgi:hypothetical protein